VDILPQSLRIVGFPHGAEAATPGFLLLELWNGKYSSIYFAVAYFSLFAELISIRTLIYPPLMLLPVPPFFYIALRMMTTFMDFWLCSGLSNLLLNQNTEYDVSLLGNGEELRTNH
jgi:hypothetical protein